MVFNRPAYTARVFAEIAKAKPPKLLVVADGPRPGRPEEAERCAMARNVVEHVDWECQVLRNYADVNLGCGRRFSTGLVWAFEQVERAIILEDDTLPSPSFFPFCEELLERYDDDERIMHISGNNYQPERRPAPYSYYFSRYCHIWGWATWRRAFRHYAFEMNLWPGLRDSSWLPDLLDDEVAAQWWRNCLDRAWRGDRSVYDSWDMQWRRPSPA